MPSVWVLRAIYAALIGVWLTGHGLAGPLEEADAADKRRDYAAAIKLVLPLAQQGNPDAQYRLGTMYASGRGVPEDYTQAEDWFQKAAAQGNLDAIWYIGLLHQLGRGKFSKNFAQAEKWYLRAAERGHLRSQTALATAYQSGTDVDSNYTEAAKWHRRAANQGDFGSQYSLAMMYEMGQGVPQDRVLAYQWYNIAASHPQPKMPSGDDFVKRMMQALDVQNYQGAVSSRDKLYREMTPSERAEGQKLTREWRARPER